MKEPIRVLQVFASLNRGGAEAVIMNLYREIDKSKVQFDFIVNKSNSAYAYEKEINDLGGRIYYLPQYSGFNTVDYIKKWESILDEHPEWQILHSHHTSPAFIYLNIANKKGIVTIAHSHIAGVEKNVKSSLKRLMRYPIRYQADFLFACSSKAAEHMYGKKHNETVIFNNAINIEKFKFDLRDRAIKRKELNINGKFVVGHIGRFDIQKNHTFLIDIFQDVIKVNKNSVLLLIGEGILMDSIKNKVAELKLQDNVIFLGVRSDIPELLSGMDVLVFPSLYEGLPVSLIEAQANGIKIIASDTITSEVNITNEIEFLSLNNSAIQWAETILKNDGGYKRLSTEDKIQNAGYDVKKNAQWLKEFYLEKIDN